MANKIATIERLYHEGASLDAIVKTVGHDKEAIRLIGYRLGLSTRPGTKLDRARQRATVTTDTTPQAEHVPSYSRFVRGKQRWSNFNEYGWTVSCSCGWSKRHNGPKSETTEYFRDHLLDAR